MLERGDSSKIIPVDLIVKPLGARWMISLYEYMKAKPAIIKNGFILAGINIDY